MTESGGTPGALRVTHFASGDLWAGAESQLFTLVVALRSSGEVAPDVVLLNEGLLAERLRDAGIPVTVFDERRHGAFALGRRLRAHLVRTGTGVLHTHRYKENVIGSAVCLTLPGVRTMRTLHGAPESAPQALDLRRRLQHTLDWLCARFVQDPVICVSHQLATRCRESLPPARIRVVENGIDLADVTRRAGAQVNTSGNGNRFHVGFFGRLAPVKRVDLILEIARALEDADPGAYRIHVFGDGPLRGELEATATRQGLERCVRFEGFVSNLAAHLCTMDALLLTSDHEGLPMVVLEAMALKVPIVSHAVGAVPDLLDAGGAGTLIQGQAVPDYVAALMALRASPAEARMRAERALVRVASHYSASNAAAAYAALYAGRR